MLSFLVTQKTGIYPVITRTPNIYHSLIMADVALNCL